MTSIRNAGDYRIQAVGDIGIHAEDRWVAVLHVPCEAYIFGDDAGHDDEVTLATLLTLIAAHHCDGIAQVGA